MPSVDAFLTAAAVPRAWHAGGTSEEARAMLAADPALASRSIHTAAVTGQDDVVAAFLADDRSLATRTGGPYAWDPLTWCCFSRLLRDDRTARDGFRRTAAQLLAAGADARTGFHDAEHLPQATFESVLYAAAGIAFDAPLTQLLLAHGADPNDDEVPYHAAETYDLGTLEVLLASGRLSPDSLATLLLRKADWHDLAGVQRLLSAGADPNARGGWPWPPLYQAIRRDNHLEIIRAMIDAGGDVTQIIDGNDLATHLAFRGRGDALRMLRDRDLLPVFRGPGAVIAACALGDRAALTEALETTGDALPALRQAGSHLLRLFAGNDNADGLAMLLALGIPVDATDDEADGYFDIAPHSTALHVASWRGQHASVRVLLAHGASANSPDGKGRTPLERAIAAATVSHWRGRRAPDSVAALLAAGANPREVICPTGYEAIDTLLEAARRNAPVDTADGG